MKKLLIGSIVGAMILFFWSFLSWAILPIHLHTFMYTPAQDSIMSLLNNGSLPESGVYGLPMADNRNVSGFDAKFQEESQELIKKAAGQPMATIYYQKDGYNMGGSTLLKGFLFNFLAVLTLCILLAPAMSLKSSYFGRWWLMLVAGLFINACGPLIQYNWMGVPWNFTSDMIVDNFMNWGIVGLWLAYYFKPAN